MYLSRIKNPRRMNWSFSASFHRRFPPKPRCLRATAEDIRQFRAEAVISQPAASDASSGTADDGLCRFRLPTIRAKKPIIRLLASREGLALSDIQNWSPWADLSQLSGPEHGRSMLSQAESVEYRRARECTGRCDLRAFVSPPSLREISRFPGWEGEARTEPEARWQLSGSFALPIQPVALVLTRPYNGRRFAGPVAVSTALT